MNAETQKTVSQEKHGTHSAEGGKQSSAQMGSGRQHNANSVTKTLGLGGGRWRVIALAFLCLISIGSLILVSWAEWVAANRSDVSRNGTIGNWEFTDLIQVTSEFIEGKNLYPYSLALNGDTLLSQENTGSAEANNVILVGLKFKIAPEAKDIFDVLNITITPMVPLENGSHFLWRYDDAPTEGIAQVESTARELLAAHEAANITVDEFDTLLGVTTTIANGAAQWVEGCSIEDSGEHAIYVYLKSDTSWDAGKAFAVTLSLEEGIVGTLSYNWIGSGWEVDKGTLPHDTQTIHIPAWHEEGTLSGPVIAVGDFGFSNMRDMIDVELPNTLTSIGLFAFCNSRLTSIAIPASVTSICESVFDGCLLLVEIKVDGDNPNYMSGDGDLYSKNGDTLIQYAIGKAAREFEVPARVEHIYDNAFIDCNNLTTVTFASGSQLESIGDYAFANCASLTSITLPEGLESIGSGAFSYSGLTSITIPASVVSIGGNAFSECNSFTTVYLLGEIPPAIWIGDYSSFGSNLTDIYVPAGKIGVYEADDAWSSYIGKISSAP